MMLLPGGTERHTFLQRAEAPVEYLPFEESVKSSFEIVNWVLSLPLTECFTVCQN